jgi:hypothetical protein
MVNENGFSIRKYAIVRPSGEVTAEEISIALKHEIVLIPIEGSPWDLDPDKISSCCGSDTEGVLVDHNDRGALVRFQSRFEIAAIHNDGFAFYESL